MRLYNKFILSIFAIIFAATILSGMAVAQGSYAYTPGETQTIRSSPASAAATPVSEILADPNVAIARSSYCFNCLPAPRLVYTGREEGRYTLAVANSDEYPASLFESAPDLPPCGLNTESSRTWVEIYDSNGDYIYGFCALSDPSDLNRLWFGVPEGEEPPESVYITLNDRRCNTILTSNPVRISWPILTRPGSNLEGLQINP